MARSLVPSGLTRVDSRLEQRLEHDEAAKHGLFQVPPLSSSKGSKGLERTLGPWTPDADWS